MNKVFFQKCRQSLFVLMTVCCACSSDNSGVETGNPQTKTRQVTGEIDSNTVENPLSFLVPDDTTPRYRMSTVGCNAEIDEIEARPLDLSDSVTASVTDLTFSIDIDQEKSYTFVTKSGGEYCGVLFYNPLSSNHCDDPQRVVVLAGEDDASFGLMGLYSFNDFEVADMPYAKADTDNDGTVDLYDDDMNGDGITDFDGNYDGYINLDDAADTGSAGDCDIVDMSGVGTSFRGTVTANDGIAEILFTGTQDFSTITLADFVLHDVDAASDLNIADVAGVSVSGDEATLILSVTEDHDYVLTIPIGSFSCADSSTQTRAITYYFRVVDYGVSYACGDGF